MKPEPVQYRGGRPPLIDYDEAIASLGRAEWSLIKPDGRPDWPYNQAVNITRGIKRVGGRGVVTTIRTYKHSPERTALVYARLRSDDE
jgi:hypothetical protein